MSLKATLKCGNLDQSSVLKAGNWRRPPGWEHFSCLVSQWFHRKSGEKQKDCSTFTYPLCWRERGIHKRNTDTPTNCDAWDYLRGSLREGVSSVAFPHLGPHQYPGPSLGRGSCPPPSFSTAIGEHRIIGPKEKGEEKKILLNIHPQLDKGYPIRSQGRSQWNIEQPFQVPWLALDFEMRAQVFPLQIRYAFSVLFASLCKGWEMRVWDEFFNPLLFQCPPDICFRALVYRGYAFKNACMKVEGQVSHDLYFLCMTVFIKWTTNVLLFFRKPWWDAIKPKHQVQALEASLYFYRPFILLAPSPFHL